MTPYEFVDRTGIRCRLTDSASLEVFIGGRWIDGGYMQRTGIQMVGREALRVAERVKELEAEVERRAAENIAMQDQNRSILGAVLEISKLFKGSPEVRAATLEQENATLRADNLSLVNRLEMESTKVVSLRLELGTLKVAAGKLRTDKAIYQNEAESLRIDLAVAKEDGQRALEAQRALSFELRQAQGDLREAIRTGEEQAEKITELRSANEHAQRIILEERVKVGKLNTALDALENVRREWLAWGNKAQKRLSRLDALLSSVNVPEGLVGAVADEVTPDTAAQAAWRWFRDILRGPIDDPVPEKEPNPEVLDIACGRYYATVLNNAKVTPEKLRKEAEVELREPENSRVATEAIFPPPLAAWYAGLSMEEIDNAILDGTAPEQAPGGTVLVPDEYLEWIARTPRGPIVRWGRRAPQPTEPDSTRQREKREVAAILETEGAVATKEGLQSDSIPELIDHVMAQHRSQFGRCAFADLARIKALAKAAEAETAPHQPSGAD